MAHGGIFIESLQNGRKSMFRRVLLFLVIPAAIVDMMHLLGIGPSWPADLLNRGWTLSALAVLLSGLFLYRYYRPAALWRFFSAVFFLIYSLFLLTTVLSVNRAIQTAADENRIGDTIGDYYKKSGITNKKPGTP